MQFIEHVHAACDDLGALVAVGLADEQELECRDEPTNEVLRRTAPFFEIRAALTPAVLVVPHLLAEPHGGIEVRAREPMFDVVRVVLEGVEEPVFRHRCFAFQLGYDVGARGGLDSHEAKHVEQHELLVVAVPAALRRSGERALDLGVRRWCDGRGAGSGGGGCGCRCGHGGSDGGVAREVVPVRDDVGTGACGGFSGDAAQHARGSWDGFDEFTEESQHSAARVETLRDEQERWASDVGDRRVQVEQDSDDPVHVVCAAEPICENIGKALLAVLDTGVENVPADGVAHGESSQWLSELSN